MNLLEFDITIPTKNISHFMKTFQEHNWLIANDKKKIKEDEAHEKGNENETTNQNHEKVNREMR